MGQQLQIRPRPGFGGLLEMGMRSRQTELLTRFSASWRGERLYRGATAPKSLPQVSDGHASRICAGRSVTPLLRHPNRRNQCQVSGGSASYQRRCNYEQSEIQANGGKIERTWDNKRAHQSRQLVKAGTRANVRHVPESGRAGDGRSTLTTLMLCDLDP